MTFISFLKLQEQEVFILTATIIKYIAIMLCSIYSFAKLINNKFFSSEKISTGVLKLSIYTVLSSFPIYYARVYFPLAHLTVFCIFVFIYTFHRYKKPVKTTIAVSVISLSLSLLSYAVSLIICIPVSYIFYSLIENQSILDITAFTFAGIVQFLCLFLFYKIKRFRNGILSFTEKLNNDLSVVFSILILFMASFFYIMEEDYLKNLIIIFIVIIFGCILLLWWKRRITNIYIEKVYKRNIDILENSLAEQQEINRKLKHSNEELSIIIHRDNKLSPAMESAVEEILACNAPDEQKEKSKALLSQLKAMSSERSAILTDYENLHRSLVQTGIFSIDASLKYLFSRANKDGISFDLSVTCDMRKAVNGLISENDLNTLILDLGENALIAVREAKKKNVLVVFGTENESFIISVYDSGIPFEKKVIDNLGKRRITTHKKTGGSGIGLMTAARLLRKHNASFVIDENVDSDSYSKRVSVIFDGLSQCRIITATNKFTRPM